MNTTATRPGSEKQIAAMFDRIAPRYDLLNKLLSARQDIRWRNQLVRWLSASARGRFLDVATGTGDVIAAVIKAGRQYSEYWGVDISPEMLRFAEPKLARIEHSSQVAFREMSAEKLDFPDQNFEALTISFGLRNVVHPDIALKEFARVLKPGSQLMILEFFTPGQDLLSRIFGFYFHKVLPKIGGLISDREAYRYLPNSVGGFYTLPQLQTQLKLSGFKPGRIRKYLFGWCVLVEAIRE
jgi:demethylmenaquinone methyltransferase/2-methoxy-6-polyprenyl-1,4-benzoquinol methylase